MAQVFNSPGQSGQKESCVMRRTSLATVLAIAPVMLLLSGGRAAAQDVGTFDQIADRDAIARVVEHPWRGVCSGPGAKFHCFAKVQTDEQGNVQKFANAQGFGPTDFQGAYKLPKTGGAGKIVAVIDAYHYTNAEADLAVYRSQFGLPACTTANGCFKQVTASGSTSFGSADQAGCGNGWESEAALDLQMASAACPDCHLLIVETPDD